MSTSLYPFHQHWFLHSKTLPARSVLIIDLNDDPSNFYGILLYTCIIWPARDSVALFFGRLVERIAARIARLPINQFDPFGQTFGHSHTRISVRLFHSSYTRVCVFVRIRVCMCVYVYGWVSLLWYAVIIIILTTFMKVKFYKLFSS